MLAVDQDVIGLTVLHNMPEDDMFKYLTTNRSKWYRSIICRIESITFLMNWYYICWTPVLRDRTKIYGCCGNNLQWIWVLFRPWLMGDKNCNLDMSQLNQNANLFCDISDVYGLQQLVNDRIRCTVLITLIDLIFTNCPERVVCSGWFLILG